MNTRRKIAMVALIATFSFLFGVWATIAVTPWSPRIAVTDQQANQQATQKDGIGAEQPGESGSQASDPIFIYTYWLTAFTFGLFLATIGLAIATGWLVLEGKGSAERQLCAYVVPTGISMICDGRRSGESDWIPRIHFKNAGQTPTKFLTVWTQVTLCSRGTTPDFPPEFPPPLHRTAGPKTEFLAGNVAFGFSLIRKVWDRELDLFATGVATYRDIFGRRRVTLACYRFDISPQPNAHLADAGHMLYCAPDLHDDWNAADDECDRYRHLLDRIPGWNS